MPRRSTYLPLCALAAACAPAYEPPTSKLGLTEGESLSTVCFTSGISGFSEFDDTSLIIRHSPGEAYLVRTGFCPNLERAEGLKIEAPDQCLNRGSRLLVYDTPLPLKNSRADKPDRCLVTEIWKLRAGSAPPMRSPASSGADRLRLSCNDVGENAVAFRRKNGLRMKLEAGLACVRVADGHRHAIQLGVNSKSRRQLPNT